MKIRLTQKKFSIFFLFLHVHRKKVSQRRRRIEIFFVFNQIINYGGMNDDEGDVSYIICVMSTIISI